MNQHTAGVGAGIAIGSPFLERYGHFIEDINAILHTMTLLVGLVAGIASIVYYWTNRKSKK